MPTPSPIIAASCGANSAVSKTWVPSVTRLSPTPSANSAVMIGSPIATTEPKVSSRMTTAASRPIEEGGVAFFFVAASSIGWPPSSTWRPSPAAPAAVVDELLAVVSLSSSLVVTSNWTVA